MKEKEYFDVKDEYIEKCITINEKILIFKEPTLISIHTEFGIQALFNISLIKIDDSDKLIKYDIVTEYGYDTIIYTTKQMTLDLMGDSKYIIIKFINELSKEDK